MLSSTDLNTGLRFTPPQILICLHCLLLHFCSLMELNSFLLDSNDVAGLCKEGVHSLGPPYRSMDYFGSHGHLFVSFTLLSARCHHCSPTLQCLAQFLVIWFQIKKPAKPVFWQFSKINLLAKGQRCSRAALTFILLAIGWIHCLQTAYWKKLSLSSSYWKLCGIRLEVGYRLWGESEYLSKQFELL